MRRVRRLAARERVSLTHKARLELSELGLELSSDDVILMLLNVEPGDAIGRVRSTETDEWLYIFRPQVAGELLYVKLVLRGDCVVISFHDDEDPQEPNGR